MVAATTVGTGKVVVNLAGGESVRIVGPASIKLKGVQVAAGTGKGMTGTTFSAAATKAAEVENEVAVTKTIAAKGTAAGGNGVAAGKGATVGAKGTTVGVKGATVGAKGLAAGKGATAANTLALQAIAPGADIEIAVGKGVIGKGVVVAGKTATGNAAVGNAAVGNAAIGKFAIPGGAAPALSSGAKAISVGGTVWSGKGLSLGLGLGLGAWGPIVVGALGLAAAAAVYGYVRKRRGIDGGQSDEELQESFS